MKLRSAARMWDLLGLNDGLANRGLILEKIIHLLGKLKQYDNQQI